MLSASVHLLLDDDDHQHQVRDHEGPHVHDARRLPLELKGNRRVKGDNRQVDHTADAVDAPAEALPLLLRVGVGVLSGSGTGNW